MNLETLAEKYPDSVRGRTKTHKKLEYIYKTISSYKKAVKHIIQTCNKNNYSSFLVWKKRKIMFINREEYNDIESLKYGAVKKYFIAYPNLEILFKSLQEGLNHVDK